MDFYYQKNKNLSLEQVLSCEWLETNGLGGYASSTISNCHTRKYHGLLVSKLDKLPNKYVLFNKLADVFVYNGKEYILSANNYPGCFQDGSLANLQEFSVTTHPAWRFEFDDIVLTKEILLLHKENIVLVKYKIITNPVVSSRGEASGIQENLDLANAPAKNKKSLDPAGFAAERQHGGEWLRSKLSLRPLLALRDFHKLSAKNTNLNTAINIVNNGFSCQPNSELPELFFQIDTKHKLVPQSLWYNNFIYTQEQERGYDFCEDLFTPAVFICDNLNAETEIIFACSLKEQMDNLSTLWQQEINYRTIINNSCNQLKTTPLQRHLHKISDSFIIKTQNMTSVVAGYHWFLEWGRDTMIALPGLTLYSGKQDLCVEVLKTFASNECMGLIPNYLGKNKQENSYNSVDASLWFVWALQQYYIKTKDLKTIKKYFRTTLQNIFKFYKNGTLHNIKMQDNGLLYAGSPEVNLTWMDAVVDGRPVTPRYGLQVEVNALWFNMLNFMHELSSLLDFDDFSITKQDLLNIKQIFCEVFWCSERRYLYDFVNSEQRNWQLRPNQIFAVSLPFSPLPIDMATDVMSAVKDNLLTPFGLRTLAPTDAAYTREYMYDQTRRDRAYHNGTVWPWLLGNFTQGLLRTQPNARNVVDIMQPCLQALQEHLFVYGVGSIAEIFSGDYPYKPNGCISQAWSVAEVFRAAYLLNQYNEV